MDIHPINQIEDEKAWRDMGKQGLLMLRGAMDEGANLTEALQVLSAFYAGLVLGAGKREEDDQKEE